MAVSCFFTAQLWLAQPEGGWFFLTLPADAADAVREQPRRRRGFGSVRVRAAVGTTAWTTSVFPDSRTGSYVLPVKKAVRLAERLDEGDPVDVRLDVLE